MKTKTITFHYFSTSVLIMARLGKKFSHVGIELDDGTYIDATLLKGVSKHPLDRSKIKYSQTITVPLDKYELVVKFLEEQLGKGYDVKALLGFTIVTMLEDHNKWFCSELGFRVFCIATDTYLEPFSLVTPTDLRYLVDGYNLK